MSFDVVLHAVFPIDSDAGLKVWTQVTDMFSVLDFVQSVCFIDIKLCFVWVDNTVSLIGVSSRVVQCYMLITSQWIMVWICMTVHVCLVQRNSPSLWCAVLRNGNQNIKFGKPFLLNYMQFCVSLIKLLLALDSLRGWQCVPWSCSLHFLVPTRAVRDRICHPRRICPESRVCIRIRTPDYLQDVSLDMEVPITFCK